MGIYDRDYERGYSNGGNGWRPEGQSGFQLRWPQTTVGWVLLVTVGVYLIELAFRGDPVRTAGGIFFPNQFINIFELPGLLYREPWRFYSLLTYGLLHSQTDLMHIGFNMFGFWLFGRELERRLGSREFLLFYAASIIAGGLAFTLGQSFAGDATPAIGASAGTTGVVILFAFFYPHMRALFMFIIPMPMWVLGMILVGLDVYGAIGGRPGANIGFTAHLGGAAFAFLYFRQQWRLSRWIPDRLEMPSFKRRPKLRVHQDDYEEDREDDQQNKLAEEVDRILAKIKNRGQESLTRKEKRTLEQASREARERRS